MTNHNAANERMKRQYFAYLADAQGHSEETIDAVAKAIDRFETYTRYKDFKTFHIEQAKAFKRWVTHEVLPSIRRTGQYGSQLPATFAEALELAAAQQREIEGMAKAGARRNQGENFLTVASSSSLAGLCFNAPLHTLRASSQVALVSVCPKRVLGYTPYFLEMCSR